MTVTERAAYLKGLMDGLKIDKESDNGKLFAGIIDLLNDIAISVADLEDAADATGAELDLIEDAIDEIDDSIEDIYDILDGDFDEDDYDFEGCDCEDDECDCDCEDECDCEDDEIYYEVVCPTCNMEIRVDEAGLEKGSLKCPGCGEELEFDLSDIEEEDEE